MALRGDDYDRAWGNVPMSRRAAHPVTVLCDVKGSCPRPGESAKAQAPPALPERSEKEEGEGEEEEEETVPEEETVGQPFELAVVSVPTIVGTQPQTYTGIAHAAKIAWSMSFTLQELKTNNGVLKCEMNPLIGEYMSPDPTRPVKYLVIDDVHVSHTVNNSPIPFVAGATWIPQSSFLTNSGQVGAFGVPISIEARPCGLKEGFVYKITEEAFKTVTQTSKYPFYGKRIEDIKHEFTARGEGVYGWREGSSFRALIGPLFGGQDEIAAVALEQGMKQLDAMLALIHRYIIKPSLMELAFDVHIPGPNIAKREPLAAIEAYIGPNKRWYDYCMSQTYTIGAVLSMSFLALL
jgi:hypothetical protein